MLYDVHTVFGQTRGRIGPEIMRKKGMVDNDIGKKNKEHD